MSSPGTYQRDEAHAYGFDTPPGTTIPLMVRPDTSDYNICHSNIVDDQYRLGALPQLEGWAVDIGAHIGSVCIPIALEHPNLRVLAIEPLPANVTLLQTNVRMNHLQGRVIVAHGAVGNGTIRANFRGDEHADHNRFVANVNIEAEHDLIEVPTFNIRQMLSLAGVERFVWAKIDCEGGEWAIADQLHRLAPRIAGEWHWHGGGMADFLDKLGDGWWQTFTGPGMHSFFLEEQL